MAKVPIGSIYLITNKINGKQYVGQTTYPIEFRWKGHVRDIKRSDSPICNAIKKYGPENFVIEEMYKAYSLKKLNDMESFYITICGTLKPNGYNLKSGGNNSFHHQETKDKISAANKGKPAYNKGKKWSDEVKKKIGIANKGKPSVLKGRPSPLKGIPRSIETRLKISVANKGRPKTLEERIKLSISKTGKPGVPHTDEFKCMMIGNKYGEGNKGKSKSNEWKLFMSVFSRNRERKVNGQFKRCK